jgi:hypothetical protein
MRQHRRKQLQQLAGADLHPANCDFTKLDHDYLCEYGCE